ncbi:MAG: nucleotidyl transferase AbiEii/AbiGii toxin family protein [Bdellovibrio sp.]|nr:nucleotidyl transferase AbiEii/AbiGii toxin family protein [Bdellovibrio sp.]
MKLQALKDRLKFIAKEKGLTSQEVWNQLAFERFLARLAKSKHNDKFIFKGGLLLSQYIKIGRETVDLDFLMKNLSATEDAIKIAVTEIARVDLGDFFKFDYESIEKLDQPHMEYDGFRVTLKMSFETMTDKVQVDIGVGDVVNPEEMDYQTFDYKGAALFSDAIAIQVYPLETILAEKLETILAEKLETIASKGAINSRMKDYHDALLIVRSGDLPEGPELKKAIELTFANRRTPLKFPLVLPQ